MKGLALAVRLLISSFSLPPPVHTRNIYHHMLTVSSLQLLTRGFLAYMSMCLDTPSASAVGCWQSLGQTKPGGGDLEQAGP